MGKTRLFLLCWTLVAVPVMLDGQQVDPCINYTPINNPYRSTQYKLVQGDAAICDDKLRLGWYRFTSKVGGMIPDKPPPGRMYCGTLAPIWVKGDHPAKVNEITTVTACMYYAANRDCLYRRVVSIKKCPGNSVYYVYHLPPTYGCPMAYCAGNKKPCPKGQDGIFPNCKVLKKAAFPEKLLPTPKINYIDKTNTFAMNCLFDQFPAWNNASFLVEWFVDGFKKDSAEICSLGNKGDTFCKERRAELPFTKFQAGQRVRCTIRMRYTTHPDNKWTATYKESDYYYAGLQVSPSHILVEECPSVNTSSFLVNVRPTVPIKSDIGTMPKWTIFTRNTRVLLGLCKFGLSTNDIKAGKNITIGATCDQIKNRPSRQLVDLDFRQVNFHTFWSLDYRAPFQVRVQNKIKKTCKAVSDPHYTTFDGKYYDFYEHGDYVLYSNPERNFEIHTRLWVCWGVSCNCGLAIREGNDVIVITACNNELKYRRHPTLLRVKVRSQCRLARGTHIYVSPRGSDSMIEVVLPSGTRIKVERTRPWLTVYLHAPMDDHGKAKGLCGDADGDQTNDFWKGGEKGHLDGTALSFARSWKLNPKESYFDKIPPKIKQPTDGTEWCDCREPDSTACQDNTVPGNAHKEGDLAPGLNNDQDCKKRSVDGYIYSDEHTMDNEEKSFFVDEEEAVMAAERLRTRRAVLSENMSKENATKICKSIIEDSTAGKMCKAVPGFNITDAMLSCIEDLQITGDLTVAGSAFNTMKEGCEETIMGNISLYKQDSNGTLRAPMELVENLCPNDCSNHGNCTNRTCICEEGYMSKDCSMSSRAIPELMGIYDGGLCDIRRRPCKKIDLFGDDFISSENLTCHVKEFKVFSSNWIPKSHTIKLPGAMIDLFGVRCHLPDPPTKLDDYDTEGTPAGGLWIAVSNDGEHKSQRQMRFISYDSVCMSCNKTGNCSRKENTCLIYGHCFALNQTNPRNWCQQCIPGNGHDSWTRRKVNHPPSFARGQSPRYAIVGETLPLQLNATDPDGRPVTYSLLNTTASSGYTLSSTGLLQWNVTSPGNKDFTIQATDECNATDTITLTVRIVVCPCKNGGQCLPHPYYPRGSGMYSCQCPTGFTGDKCEINIDDCVSVNCGNGTCIDGVNNYTCRCNAGFEGSSCDQKIHKCTNESCFAGVQCTESISGISCGPCPVGMSGDGKTCTAPTTTREPTTTAPTTTREPTTTAAPTTTREPTTTAAPTTTHEPTTTAPTTMYEPTTTATTTEKLPETTTKTTTEKETISSSSFPTEETTTEKETTVKTEEPLTEESTTVDTEEPSTTESTPEETKVKAEISLTMEWKSVYEDKQSTEYQSLVSRIKNEIFESYRKEKNGNLKEVKVISLRSGSVIAEFQLVFKTAPKDPLLPLKKSIEDGTMGTLKVNPDSLKIINSKTEEDSKDYKLVITIVLVVIAVIIIQIAIVVVVYRSKKYHTNYRLKNHSSVCVSNLCDEQPKEKFEMDQLQGWFQEQKTDREKVPSSQDFASNINAGFQ